jgi:hypothetical protein
MTTNSIIPDKLSMEELDSATNDPAYSISHDLASGASLEILFFDRFQGRWIFKYRYIEYPSSDKPVDRSAKPDLVNEITVYVDYLRGLATSLDMSMHIVWPKRRGKAFAYGMDISPGSQVNLRFVYRREVAYRLSKVHVGASRVIDFDIEDRGALVRQIDLPFPVLDILESEFGRFSVPFIDNDGREQNFVFPSSIIKGR